jgi:hypothetical protein
MHFDPDGWKQLHQRSVSDDPAEHPYEVASPKMLSLEQCTRKVNSDRAATRGCPL